MPTHIPRPGADRQGRAAARDEALGRMRRLTRGLAVATIAAVGAVTAYVAHVLPGHTVTTSPTPSSGQGTVPTTSPTTAPSSDDGGATGQSPSPSTLAPPSTTPTTTQTPRHVMTGASGF